MKAIFFFTLFVAVWQQMLCAPLNQSQPDQQLQQTIINKHQLFEPRRLSWIDDTSSEEYKRNNSSEYHTLGGHHHHHTSEEHNHGSNEHHHHHGSGEHHHHESGEHQHHGSGEHHHHSSGEHHHPYPGCPLGPIKPHRPPVLLPVRNCHKFIICDNFGRGVLMDCVPSHPRLVFDPKTKRCEWPWNTSRRRCRRYDINSSDEADNEDNTLSQEFTFDVPLE